MPKFLNTLDMTSQKIVNLADPSAAQDGVNLQYLQNFVRGLQWKAPVRVATTANGTLATAYANGQSVDGVALATNDRILLKNQTTGSENGIYTVNASGAPTRAVDADGGSELAPGTTVSVTEGTANGDKAFMIISDAAITIGTTSQTWGQLGGGGTTYTGGNGINVAGSVISAVQNTGIIVNGSGIGIDTSVVARKFSSSIGNGSSTSIAVTHNLGTKDVSVTCRQNSDDAHIIADYVSTDTNNVTITFATAPASNAIRVTVIG